MKKIRSWYEGSDNYKHHTLTIDGDILSFHTDIIDKPIQDDITIQEVWLDELNKRQCKYVEVLYSGGLDSEPVVQFCLDNNIPVKCITGAWQHKNKIINTHDLYYAQKFCINNNIEHNVVNLDIDSFIESAYETYFNQYYIRFPHVATHMWLLEQCTGFPIIGGGYTWCQYPFKNCISPGRNDFANYDEFMKDNNIHGIGNMLGCNYSSNYLFVKSHIKKWSTKKFSGNDDKITYLKLSILNDLNLGNFEPRLKSFGWEVYNNSDFNIWNFAKSKFKNNPETITWHKQLGKLFDSNGGTNSLRS